MPSVLDLVAGAFRPVPIRGKGFALNFVTPRAGARTVRVWDRTVMTLDLANAIHRMIYMGAFSPHITAHLRHLLPAGGTFLDVGANIGYFSLLASRLVGEGGRVFAVEPNPGAFGSMRASLDANGVRNVEARMIALAEADGMLRLYVPPAAENRDYNVTVIPSPGWTPVDVPCHRLDERLADWKVDRVDLMKLDVEGAEPRVLAGGVDPLKGGVVRHLIVEVNGPRLVEGGSSPAKLVDQLVDLGFAPAKLAGGRAVTVPVADWDLAPEHEFDRLFVHRSAR